jgi:hypothetical protein
LAEKEPLTPTPAGQRLTDLLCQNATRIMGEKVGTKGVPLLKRGAWFAKTLTETYSPAAIDIAPATRPATPAVNASF